MMGICGTPSPVQGVENGLACDRSTDVWGIALDASCRASIVWPTAGTGQDGTTKGVPGDAPGTYVTTQTDGPALCAPGHLPGAPSSGAFLPTSSALAQAGAGCRDRLAPRTRVRGRVHATRRRLSLRGLATDRGCLHGKANAAVRRNVRVVRVSIGWRRAHSRCRFLLGSGRFGPATSCARTSYLSARGTSRWHFARRVHLPRGRYV